MNEITVAAGSSAVATRVVDVRPRGGEADLRRLLDAVEDYGIYMLDRAGCVVTWNTGASRLTGYEPDDMVGAHVSRLFPEQAVARGDAQRILEVAAAVGRVEDESPRVRKDGSRFLASVVVSVLRDERGRTVGFAEVLRDITEHKRGEERLRWLADRDDLTGLWNRRRFVEELARYELVAERYGEPGAVLMIDVDEFKRVNDSDGHAAGDRLLVEIAGVLCGRLRKTDVLARVGGDEFAVLLPRLGANDVQMVAQTLSETIRARARHPSRSRGRTVSIGVALIDSEHGFHDALLRADWAMYHVKRAGGDGYSLEDQPPVPFRRPLPPRPLQRLTPVSGPDSREK